MKIKIIILTIIFSMNSHQTTKSKTLKIISFNLNEKLKLKKPNFQIFKLLKELDADIICLQEASQKNQLNLLTKKLNMFWNSNAWHKGGMTILSKFKILDWKMIEIPNSYYNAFVAIKINPNIWISSIHLWSEDYLINDTERLREMNFILNQFDQLNADRVILAGDFNSLETSEVANLLESKNYIDTHKNQPWAKSTWMPSNNFERIDRIYIKGNFKLINGKVIDHNDIKWLKDSGWPTGQDHRLVITELEI